ncbi:MAG TPA: Crp/Fnr family transcriptional regulator [Pyrinomonadaceae bacterium]|jgi:CRP-like cAMP-binding protein|nr:Crp/Fnr family transcriptional regulator [Pyrinomonadaceae bacterium]
MSATVVRQEEVNNKILASLPAEEFAEVAPLLQPVGLEAGDRLYDLDEILSHVHFVDGGLLSLLSTLEDGTSIEVGSLGREGLGGLTVLLGAERATHTGLVQVGGLAYRMKAAHAREVFQRLPAFQEKVLHYTRMLVAQISLTAACNTLHTVEERLARWLLMCRRRLESDRLPLTQEFLSHMLGVRRSGVTVAVGILEQAGLIGHRRGTVVVTNPEGLREASCECVKAMGEEYDAFLNS